MDFNSSGNKLTHLESARGIASIIVLFHHYVIAFAPSVKYPLWKGGVWGTPLYGLVNGGAAVAFFFVLSGFVLTQGFFRAPSLRKLAGSVVKRLPRLVLPVGASILAGWAILTFADHPYRRAADISGSKWLASFANANFPENFSPSITDALRQSMMTFFHRGDYYYNTNLWTMNYEFFGSMIAFAIIFAFIFLKDRISIVAQGAALALLGIAVLAAFPLFATFVFGALLAWTIRVANLGTDVGRNGRIALVVLAALSLSIDNILVLTIGAMATMILLLQPGQESGALSGGVGRWLGQISFPLYLVHTLVILSAGSYWFHWISAAGATRAAVLVTTLAVTGGLSLAASLPLVSLERVWVPFLNRLTRWVGLG